MILLFSELGNKLLSHTWIHSSTFRHTDESHAPFLHFCSYIVFLGHTDSYLSVSHRKSAELSHSLCFNNSYTLLLKKHVSIVSTFHMSFSNVSHCPPCPDIELWEVDVLSGNLFMSTEQLRGPTCDISKIVSVHSRQMTATQ